jgi:ribonuclease P protein component
MKEQTKTFFRTVMKSGGLVNSEHLSLKIVKDSSLKSEVRVVVSKKVIPLAVSRNSFKRRVRQLFEEMDLKSVQAIFFAKKGVGEISLKELREEVVYLIDKL